jgi:ABC-type multidrug transport system fused ATPase/permease subunit
MTGDPNPLVLPRSYVSTKSNGEDDMADSLLPILLQHNTQAMERIAVSNQALSDTMQRMATSIAENTSTLHSVVALVREQSEQISDLMKHDRSQFEHMLNQQIEVAQTMASAPQRFAESLATAIASSIEPKIQSAIDQIPQKSANWVVEGVNKWGSFVTSAATLFAIAWVIMRVIVPAQGIPLVLP